MAKKLYERKCTISILGCGWLGLSLGKFFAENQLKVKGSTTQSKKLALLSTKGLMPYKVDMTTPNNRSDFFKTDVLIITVPPSAREYLSIVSNTISAIEANQVEKIIFISATTVYPELNRVVTEDDAQNIAAARSGIRLLEIEEMFRRSKKFSTTILRFGGLYGPHREPGRFMEGRKHVKGADVPVNLVHLDDCIGVIEAILKKNVWGEILNVCAPQHPQKREFYTKACLTIGLPPPNFSDEPAPFKLVSSKKMENLLGYQFQHPDPMRL